MKDNTLSDFEDALDAGDLQQAINILRAGGAASSDEMDQLCEMLTTHHLEDEELKEFFPYRLVQIGRAVGKPYTSYSQKLKMAKEIAAKFDAALKIEGKKYLAFQRVHEETGFSISTIKRALAFCSS